MERKTQAFSFGKAKVTLTHTLDAATVGFYLGVFECLSVS